MAYIEPITVLPFGCRDTSEFRHITLAQMFANPTITCKEANCKISKCTVQILVKKKNEVFGPYSCRFELGKLPLDKMRALKDTLFPCRMFIDVENVVYRDKLYNARKAIAFDIIK